MKDIYVVGVGMTPFGRHPDKSVKQLASWAVEDALQDAGCGREHVQAAFFGNSAQGYMEGQLFIRGQVALLPQGFGGIPIINVENACATASTAFHLAVNQLRAGAADVVLAVGVEKMYSSDKAKMFALFDSGWDLETVEANARQLKKLGEGVEAPAGTTSDKPYSVFMDVYAAFARQLMRRHGITQRQIAAVAAKNHVHSVHNERAQYRKPMTVEEVLASAPITFPITLPMCAPISDGAAAAILCTGEAIARYGLDSSRAVRVRASVMRSATARDCDDLANHITRLTANAAYQQAGIGPADMHLAEVHDATAVGELIQTENLGFCEPGGSGALAESGATTLGGRIPVNPSGGLESKGHPIGATGLGQIFELVSQLRHECGPRQVQGARFAVQENGGGLWGVEEAAAHVGIFERVAG
ncbi:MAG: thiolase family protein [Burkholderiales bacterium]|nr:thiolase family protein [Burkholderiales bacterium]